jgi:hypothetical protein
VEPEVGGSGKSSDEIAQAYRSEPWWYDVRGMFILTFAYNSTLGHQLRFFGPNYGPDTLKWPAAPERCST